MNILIAIDKFKGSLTSHEVGEALSTGILSTFPTATMVLQSMADGGDGSLEVLASTISGDWVIVDQIEDPIGRKRKSKYFRSDNRAFIEMALASGIQLLGTNELNPMEASSFGTGQLILHAINHGCEEIFLFIGGSASTDGGTGALQAIGVDFFDQENTIIPRLNGKSMGQVNSLQITEVISSKVKGNIQVLCDVNNHFFGPQGAAKVYAKQKGADAHQIKKLDDNLSKLAHVFSKQLNKSVQYVAGSGAAGGLAGGLFAVLDANLISGVDAMIKWTNLDSLIKQADVIITGEGRIDNQSLQGKLIDGICRKAAQHNKPVKLVAGNCLLKDFPDCVVSVDTVLSHADDLSDAINNPKPKLQKIGEEIGKTLLSS